MHHTTHRSRSLTRLLITLGLGLAICACGVGPKLGPFVAHAPKERRTQFSAVQFPTMAVGVSRQFTDRLDAGLTQEGLVTDTWLKYRVLDNSEGLAIAGTLGAFRGDPDFEAKGAHIGAITSYRYGRWTWTLAARVHRMDYMPLELGENEEGHLAFPRINTDRLERYHSIDLIASFRLRSGADVHLGIRCGDDQEFFVDQQTGYDAKEGCLPILGLSLF